MMRRSEIVETFFLKVCCCLLLYKLHAHSIIYSTAYIRANRSQANMYNHTPTVMSLVKHQPRVCAKLESKVNQHHSSVQSKMPSGSLVSQSTIGHFAIFASKNSSCWMWDSDNWNTKSIKKRPAEAAAAHVGQTLVKEAGDKWGRHIVLALEMSRGVENVTTNSPWSQNVTSPRRSTTPPLLLLCCSCEPFF